MTLVLAASDAADLDVGLVSHYPVRGGHHRLADTERETPAAGWHDVGGELRAGERPADTLLLESTERGDVFRWDVDDGEAAALGWVPIADGSREANGSIR